MSENAFCVVLFCGRSDLWHLPSLSLVAEHKQHVPSVDSVGDDHFYLICAGGAGKAFI